MAEVFEEVNQYWPWIVLAAYNNITEESVYLLGGSLSRTDKFVLRQEDAYDLPSKCEKIGNNIAEEGIEDNKDLYRCASFAGVVRYLHDQPNDLQTYWPDFYNNLSWYNINDTEKNLKISENLVTQIGNTLIDGCKDISCGRSKGALEKEQGKMKINEYCTAENLLFNGGKQLQSLNLTECRGAMCNRVRYLMKADPDIGGAGVFISYLLQVVLAIAIGFYILTKLIMGGKRRRYLRQLHPQSVPVEAQRQMDIDVHPAFTRALLNFQRAQAWFVATIVIAASVRNLRHAVSDLDRYLLVSVMLSGLALLSFSQLAMHQLSPTPSWPTLAISTVSYIVCAIFYCVALSNRGDRIARIYRYMWTCNKTELEEVNVEYVRKFLDTVGSIPKSAYGAVLVITSLIMVLVLADSTKKFGGHWHKLRPLYQGIIWINVGIIYLLMLVMQGFVMGPYFKIVDFNEWGFGQILAVLIFVPLLYDYFTDRLWEKDEETVRKREAFEKLAAGHYDYEMRDRYMG